MNIASSGDVGRRAASLAAILVLIVPSLSGCVALVEAAAMEEVGLGVAEGGGFGAASGEAVISEMAVSDDMTPAAEGLRVDPGAQGELGSALQSWTRGGAQVGRIGVAASGDLWANGSLVGRLGPEGEVLAPNGLRIGRLGAQDGLLYETLADGSERPIGTLRGFVRGAPVDLYTDWSGRTRLEVLQPGEVLEVVAVRDGWYEVRLVNGEIGWIPAGALPALFLLGAAQAQPACPPGGDGIAVLNDGRAVRVDGCSGQPEGWTVAIHGQVYTVPRPRIVYFLCGDIVSRRPRSRPRYLHAVSDMRVVPYLPHLSARAIAGAQGRWSARPPAHGDWGPPAQAYRGAAPGYRAPFVRPAGPASGRPMTPPYGRGFMQGNLARGGLAPHFRQGARPPTGSPHRPGWRPQG